MDLGKIFIPSDIEVALKAAKINSKQLKSKSDVVVSKEDKTSKNKVEIDYEGFPGFIKFKKVKEHLSNVLVVADTHFPFCKQGYLEHCLNIAKKYYRSSLDTMDRSFYRYCSSHTQCLQGICKTV